LADGAILSGDGAITAHVRIADGAVLSPGMDEPEMKVGLLATTTPVLIADLPKSRMTWGEGGRYRWEINDAEGDAGAPFGRGWDVMRVGAILEITSTPEEPFTIEPVALGTDGEAGAVAGLIPRQQYRWLIAEIGKINAFSATIAGFAPNKFGIDLSSLEEVYPGVRPDDLWLDIDSEGIYLNAMIIPEPASGVLAAIGMAAWGLRIRNAKNLRGRSKNREPANGRRLQRTDEFLPICRA
jgi:hypothetical protein